MIPTAGILSRTRSQADDNELIESIRGGQLDAFAELYRRHADRIYALLTRMLGPVSEREDLLQEVFVEAHRALPSFRGDAAFSTFLYRIAVRVAYDHLRHGRRAAPVPIADGMLDDLVSPDASPLEQAEARRELQQAFRLLATLSAKQRMSFVLVAIEGLSLAEAAGLLGAGEQAVKQRVLAARKELLRGMAQESKRNRHD